MGHLHHGFLDNPGVGPVHLFGHLIEPFEDFQGKPDCGHGLHMHSLIVISLPEYVISHYILPARQCARHTPGHFLYAVKQ